MDLIIIGGGPGGYVAAIRASQLGMNVTLIEKEHLGGTCLNVGCIPTKALFRNAQVLASMQEAEEYGICFAKESITLDLDRMQEEKQKIVTGLVDGVEGLLKANKVTVVRGEGRLRSATEVEVVGGEADGQVFTADKILLATGSNSAVPPIEGIDTPGVWTSTEALNVTKVPARLAVIGGGVIGMEFVGIFTTFGSEVTVFEFLPNILPPLDEEISRRSKMMFTKKGVAFHTGTAVRAIRKEGEEFVVSFAKGEETNELTFDAVLVATGRTPVTEGLGLEELGVGIERRAVKVDENYETNVKGIYAIGDAIGGTMLAHVASEEGKVCVERMAGLDSGMDYGQVPSAVFTFPEIAAIGATEKQLKEEGVAYKAAKVPFSGNGKAQTMHEADGILKVLAKEDGSEILGVHIIGPNASDLITEAASDMAGGISVEKAAEIIHGHPTLSEVFEEALLLLLGRGIHTPPKK